MTKRQIIRRRLGSRHVQVYTLRMAHATFIRCVGVLTGLSILCGAACRQDSTATDRPLSVFVAASLATVTRDIANEFTTQTGIAVNISIAASGVLRRQIEAGAPCDVFISADDVEMDLLAQAKRILPQSRTLLARNQLVIVARDGGKTWKSADPLTSGSWRIAIGDPRYVPAGRYAQKALQQLNLWDALKDRLILADNVRVALQYVNSQQADLAIVYAADVKTSDCHVLYRFLPEVAKIECFGAACSGSRQRDNAEAFLKLMTEKDQSKIWARHGFQPVARGR